MKSPIAEELLEQGLVAVIRGVGNSLILPVVEAIYNGGITAVEIAINQQSKETIADTFEAVRLIRERYGSKILIGVGTVLTPEQVDAAGEAQFIFSPNVNVDVIQKTKEKGMVSIPGAITPSEIVTAYQAGADIIKLFPINVFGSDYIRALMGPLSHIPYMGVGGIMPKNMKEYIKSGICGFGIGSNLVNLKYVNEGNFEEIERTARVYYNTMQMLKQGQVV